MAHPLRAAVLRLGRAQGLTVEDYDARTAQRSFAELARGLSCCSL